MKTLIRPKTTLVNLIVGLAIVGTACSSSSIISESRVRIAENQWTSVSTKEFRARGPAGELCLLLEGAYSADPMSPGVLTSADGRRVSLTGRILNGVDGGISLGEAFTRDKGEEKQICFDQPAGLGDVTYRAIELKATTPVVARRITWSSGERPTPL
jgi:hypothetical protein